VTNVIALGVLPVIRHPINRLKQNLADDPASGSQLFAEYLKGSSELFLMGAPMTKTIAESQNEERKTAQLLEARVLTVGTTRV
jgi:hypothetical protein